MITVAHGGMIFRYGNGSFVAAWKLERADEHVPDVMISIPGDVRKSRITRSTIERLAKEHTNA